MDIVIGVAGNRHNTRLRRVLELPVTATLPDSAPPGGLHQADHVWDLHRRARFSPRNTDKIRTVRLGARIRFPAPPPESAPFGAGPGGGYDVAHGVKARRSGRAGPLPGFRRHRSR